MLKTFTSSELEQNGHSFFHVCQSCNFLALIKFGCECSTHLFVEIWTIAIFAWTVAFLPVRGGPFQELVIVNKTHTKVQYALI